MARETKVGLLAGLAFIVCFAVILANRGQPYGAGSYHSLFVGDEAPSNGPITAAQPPIYDNRNAPARIPRTASPNSLTLRQSPPLEHSHQGTLMQQQAQAPGASGAELSWSTEPSSPSRSTDSMLSAMARNPNEPARDLDQYLNEQQSPRLTSSPMQPHSSPRDSEGARSASQSALSRSGAALEIGRTGRSGATYTVIAGDTLTSIVQRHYGSRSKRHIDALLDANRSLLADPDVLKVGMTLVLPDVAPDAAAPETSSHRAAAPANRSAPERSAGQLAGQPVGFRWYQVKPNDRYVAIARDELGDASRWQELYELNKDKFPDPDRIREGVRIKLPVDGDAGNGRRR